MSASAATYSDSSFAVTPRSRGAPTKFTDENCALLLNAIKDGMFLEDACAIAGIDYSTYAKWQQHARNNGPSSPYFDFFQLVQQTESMAKQSLLSQWREHFPRDYKAIRDYMSRRWPDQYADQSKRQIDVNVSGQVQTTNIHVLTPVALPDLYRLLAGAGALVPSVIEGPSTPSDEQT